MLVHSISSTLQAKSSGSATILSLACETNCNVEVVVYKRCSLEMEPKVLS